MHRLVVGAVEGQVARSDDHDTGTKGDLEEEVRLTAWVQGDETTQKLISKGKWTSEAGGSKEREEEEEEEEECFTAEVPIRNKQVLLERDPRRRRMSNSALAAFRGRKGRVRLREMKRSQGTVGRAECESESWSEFRISEAAEKEMRETERCMQKLPKQIVYALAVRSQVAEAHPRRGSTWASAASAYLRAQDDKPPERVPPPPLTFALVTRAASSSSPASASASASAAVAASVAAGQSARPRARRGCPP
ncbi:hypothetical protein FB451DRAFT_1192460 [Mycena latifolia]|nr:hypothetical protein FB451DRAFT_1192460 [Mycena latifolia]